MTSSTEAKLDPRAIRNHFHLMVNFAIIHQTIGRETQWCNDTDMFLQTFEKWWSSSISFADPLRMVTLNFYVVVAPLQKPAGQPDSYISHYGDLQISEVDFKSSETEIWCLHDNGSLFDPFILDHKTVKPTSPHNYYTKILLHFVKCAFKNWILQMFNVLSSIHGKWNEKSKK